eukprot:scpid80753/ scgid28074/ 
MSYCPTLHTVVPIAVLRNRWFGGNNSVSYQLFSVVKPERCWRKRMINTHLSSATGMLSFVFLGLATLDFFTLTMRKCTPSRVAVQVIAVFTELTVTRFGRSRAEFLWRTCHRVPDLAHKLCHYTKASHSVLDGPAAQCVACALRWA